MKRTISPGLIFVLLMAAGSVLSAADSYQTESVIGDLPSIFNSFSVDSGQGFGLDIPFVDSPFMATLAAKYLISDLKEDGGPREIAIDPLIGSIGIGVRF
jgi:hypothetical protein